MPLTIFFVVGGIVGMIFGSYYFIEGSVKIAKFFEIDETIIAQKVVHEIYDGVKTSELDEISSP